MKSLHFVDFFVCAIIFIFVFFECTSAELEQTKNRRGGGASGLFAYPRVGRSDPSLSNNLHENVDMSDLFDNMAFTGNSPEEYDEYSKSDIKRANIMANFPRVGRTNDNELRKLAHWLAWQQTLDKRAGPSATSGLWFGPRLGKRSAETKDATKHQKDDY